MKDFSQVSAERRYVMFDDAGKNSWLVFSSIVRAHCSRRRRKSLIKDPLKPAKRQKITQPDIDSIGKERAARADTHDPRNRSNTSSGSSDDDDEFNTLEKFVNRSNVEELTDDERKNLGNYVLHRFKKFYIITIEEITDCVERLLKALNFAKRLSVSILIFL